MISSEVIMVETGSQRDGSIFAGLKINWFLLIGTGILAVGLMISAMCTGANGQEATADTGAALMMLAQSSVSNDTKMNKNVDGYGDRLRKNGGTLQEWMKLVRYYSALGQEKKAAQALADAKENLKDNPQAIRRLKRFAKYVGLKS